MHYDGTIRIQGSIDVSKINNIAPASDYLKIQSKFAEMGKSLMPLYSAEHMKNLAEELTVFSQSMNRSIFSVIDNSWAVQTSNLQNIIGSLCSNIVQVGINAELKTISDSMNGIVRMIGNYDLLHIPFNDNEEDCESEEINSKIVSEIFSPDQEKKPNQKDSAIITLSPVNDEVLKYLSENPMALYHLTGIEFEAVMAEIYNKLGYKVEHTQSTRDGGKDIIIRKPEILGDFIYYVECKKYAPKRPIGVGIIRNLVGTINTDRVNGGILATTSFFSRDAKNFVLENKYSYQIQMHDYNMIRNLLDRVV